jgi:glutamate-ammonia-ligase adenylyltransferase
LARGGLVDLEFMVHYLQLRDQTGFSPDLSSAIAQLVAAGHLSQEVDQAHKLMTRVLVAGRLLAPDLQAPPAAAAAALARACQCESFESLLQGLADARHGVATAWTQTFKIELEID